MVSGQKIPDAAPKPAKNAPRARNNYLPGDDHHYRKTQSYIEPVPVPEYNYASEKAYEAFDDLKYGVRIHWGLYSIIEGNASWPLLSMTNEKRQEYFELYKQFNPRRFDADAWMKLFADNGARMFAITTKHTDGFSLFDTKTRVKQRVNWMAPDGPVIEDCDLAFGIMDSPFKRDIVRELCEAARRRDIKIDLYFPHPDWYDADFRTYGYHPMMTMEGKDVLIPGEFEDVKNFQGGKYQAIGPNHTPEQRKRMLERHRAQLKELLTSYGKVDMICLDQWMAGDLWPEMRKTMIEIRRIQPDVMYRARGVGHYGDYYTNEGFIPDDKQTTNMPWFVTNSVTYLPSYDPDLSRYKDGRWIIHSLIDSVAKGGNFMVGFGPDKDGEFHPKVIQALQDAGEWLKVNGQGIYATRARPGPLWREGENIRFTRTKDRKLIYAFCLKWPGESVKFTTVKPRAGSSIHMPGISQPLKWKQTADGVVVEIPKQLREEPNRPRGYAWVMKIEAADTDDS